jgi:hypothetical protein
VTAPTPGYRPCFSGYTAPRSGKQYRCMRARGHGGAHTCAGISWSDAEADWLTAPAAVELPAEVRCASLHVGCCSKALYACTREPGHDGDLSGIVSWTDDKAVQ